MSKHPVYNHVHHMQIATYRHLTYKCKCFFWEHDYYIYIHTFCMYVRMLVYVCMYV